MSAFLAYKTVVKPKTKDAVRLNLYLDKRVVETLDSLSIGRGLSRSAIVEQLTKDEQKRLHDESKIGRIAAEAAKAAIRSIKAQTRAKK